MGKSNPVNSRKRVEATESGSGNSGTQNNLVRAKDGSAFTRCEECNKDVAVALISMHCCSLDAKIKMNLESQVVERPTEVKKKPAERKKSTSTEPKAKRGKKGTDPNMPKRPSTSFFLFMDDFRKSYKEANPDLKDVKVVAKEGGEKWKSMTDEEKKHYQDKASELKAEYEKALESYNADDEDEEGSQKEVSEKEVEVLDDVLDDE